MTKGKGFSRSSFYLRQNMKIKKGDTVKIISGNDRGKQGAVIAVFPKQGTIVVEGTNIKKKHVRPRVQGKKGELVRLPAPMRVSRVMIVCPKCNRAARFGVNSSNEGGRIRVCKKCGGEM